MNLRALAGIVMMAGLLFGLLAPNTILAGEKEEAQLRVDLLQERAWRIESQGQLLQLQGQIALSINLPKVQAELEQARKTLAEIEKKAAKPKKD